MRLPCRGVSVAEPKWNFAIALVRIDKLKHIGHSDMN